MSDNTFINPKRSIGSVFAIDEPLYDRMPSLLTNCLFGMYRYSYKEEFKIDGSVAGRYWYVKVDNYAVQIDAGYSRHEKGFIVFILSHPEARSTLLSIVKMLAENGAKWVKGIKSDDK